MKKVFFVLCAVMCLSAFANAEFGIGLKAGMGEDDNNLATAVKDSGDENKSIAGLEILWQQGGLWGLSDNQIIGVKTGLDLRGQLKYNAFIDRYTFKNNIYDIPVTVYFKYVLPDTKFNIWGGLGATIVKSEWKAEDMDSSNSFTHKNNKVYPHIKVGAEWRPVKAFAIGLDAGYLFGNNLDSAMTFDDEIKRDISGFEGALAARFYFL